MKAMIFAAGLGTRLKPITDTMPKALVSVCGRPLLEQVICRLRDSGYPEIVVNVHHFADMVEEFLSSHDFGVRISVSDERSELLETGGAILHAKPYLCPEGSSSGFVSPAPEKASRGHKTWEKPPGGLLRGGVSSGDEISSSDGEPFLVHNVDIISNLDLEWFRRQTRPEALATLLVSERETQRYFLFNHDMRLVGWTNLATGEVRSPFPELDPSACRRYAFAGIHNISPRIFGAFDSLGFSGRFPIVDFYLKACAVYPIYGVVPEQLRMVDVGKLDSLAKAEELCRSIL